MNPARALKSLTSRTFVNSDDDSVQVELIPVGSRAQEGESPIDPEIGELLRFAAGFDLDGFEVRFDGSAGGQHTPGFGADMAILEDGYGNSWNVDIIVRTGKWGPVYFMCHDPPVVVLQSPSLTEFILDVAKEVEAPDDNGPLNRIQAKAAMRIWEQGGLERRSRDAAGHEDPAIKAAAQVAGPRGFVIDMRRAQPGDGFRWAIGGRPLELHRIGEQSVWAMVSE